MSTSWIRPCITGFFLLLLATGLSAQQPAKEKEQEQGKKRDEIHMTADKLTYDDKKKFVKLINNVKITYQEVVLTSQKGDFDGEKKIGYFTGGVKMWKPGSVLTGDRMDVYYQEKRVVVRGHTRAVMESENKEKKDASSPAKSDEGPTIMTCEEIEFFWETSDGIARNNVKIWRKEKTAYADTATYTHNAELVTLSGNVRFERSSKDWMTCPEAYYDLKTETFVALGGVESNVELQKEEKKEEKPMPEEDRILSPSLNLLDEEVFYRDIPPQYEIRQEEKKEMIPEKKEPVPEKKKQ